MRILAGLFVVVVMMAATVHFMLSGSPFSGGTSQSDLVSSLKALTSSSAGTGDSRMWTDTQGRRIVATILGATRESVTIRRESDGQVFTISVQRLSPTDRAFVEKWRTAPVK